MTRCGTKDLFLRELVSSILVIFATVTGAMCQEPGAGLRMSTTAELQTCLLQPACTQQKDAAFELATRNRFRFLLSAYRNASEVLRQYIVEGIWGSERGRNNQSVIEFMGRIAFQKNAKRPFSDKTWYALQFLAERCDERALQALNRGGRATRTSGWSYEVPCNYWAETLKTFGRCRYSKARETLLNCLDSSCLDVMNAAEDSLDTLYPRQCKNFKTFSQARSCYTKLWAREKTPETKTPETKTP